MKTISGNKKTHRGLLFDNAFRILTLLSALVVAFIFFGIIYCLIAGSLPAIKQFGFSFLTSQAWNPVTEQFGALVPLIGTIITSCIALLIAVPISFGIAFYLTEIAPRWLAYPFGLAIELLAAIPSIIYGMWGLFIFAPFFAEHGQPWLINTFAHLPVLNQLFQGPPMGIGLLTAGLILSIMILPFVSMVMRDVFNFVPALLKESAYALGATKWEVMCSVVLPHTRIGVMGGIMLGLGRALGETMAVAFVVGNSHVFSWSLISPGSNITSLLANEFNEAIGKLYTSSLIALGLILFILTFVMIFFSKLMTRRLKPTQ